LVHHEHFQIVVGVPIAQIDIAHLRVEGARAATAAPFKLIFLRRSKIPIKGTAASRFGAQRDEVEDPVCIDVADFKVPAAEGCSAQKLNGPTSDQVICAKFLVRGARSKSATIYQN